jgi:hypothetical protein
MLGAGAMRALRGLPPALVRPSLPSQNRIVARAAVQDVAPNLRLLADVGMLSTAPTLAGTRGTATTHLLVVVLPRSVVP